MALSHTANILVGEAYETLNDASMFVAMLCSLRMTRPRDGMIRAFFSFILIWNGIPYVLEKRKMVIMNLF